MNTWKSVSWLVAFVLAALPLALPAQDQAGLDSAFRSYWVAATPQQTERAIAAIVASGAPFDSVLARLRRGRTYSNGVATGRQDRTRISADGLVHRYFFIVPEDYDPSRRYPVRFFLHGGIARPAWAEGGEWWSNSDRVSGSGWISVFPASWNESLWWQQSQIENLAAILDELKRTYNVDENRIHLVGFSDGGTGVYFQAFRATTRWAGYLPFIAHPAVLSSWIDVTGQMHVLNLTNKPLFVVTGGFDRLYPTADVVPFLDAFVRAGAEIVFRPQPMSGHDAGWWPSEAARIDSFIQHTVRNPYPTTIHWETERTDQYNRAHWIVVTELGSATGESMLDDFNTIPSPPALGIVPLENRGRGVRVLLVDTGSVAEAAGLIEGDLIVSVNGIETPTVQHLAGALEDGTFGSTLPIVFERGGRSVSATLRFPTETQSMSALFPRRARSGRIVVAQHANAVSVRTTGVRGFKLLLSPDQFDLTRPLTVYTNGTESFAGTVAPDLTTLLYWAAQDNDRTMLFAAEIEIALEPDTH